MTVRQIIATALGISPARVTPDAMLKGDLCVDCLDLMTIAAEVEEAFEIELSDDTVEGWVTCADVARAVEGRVVA